MLARRRLPQTPVEEVETKAAAPVTVVTVQPATLEGIVSATGIVAAAPGADWTITAPEAARIIEIPKAEGDRVKPGDLLVRFEIPVVVHRRGDAAGRSTAGRRASRERRTHR